MLYKNEKGCPKLDTKGHFHYLRPPYLSEQTSEPLSALIMFGVRPDHANDVQNFGQHGRDFFRLGLSQFFTRSFQC